MEKKITNVSDTSSEVPADSTANLRTPAPNSPFENRDFSGTTLGNYQLVRKIAEGGMGVVYEAIQLNLSRKVALKILSEQLAARPEFLERFQREARAAAALNHPNLVQVHDFGSTQGWHYLIMEFVEGQDLGNYLEQHGKVPIPTALEIIEQAALALRAATEKSIIHRDIKPSNLMLTLDGRVKVSDMGLAKILTEDSNLTLTGVGMGSPYFIAPEQASDARDVDHRADIYSLGLTLLFLLTGRRPFEGNTPFSIVLAHSNKPLPSGAELGTELPEEVETLIRRMAAKDRDERYADYESLLADLRLVKAGFTPAFERPAERAPLLSRPMMFAGASILLIASAVGAFFLVRSHKTVAVTKANSQAASPTMIVQATAPPAGRQPLPDAPPIEQFSRAPENPNPGPGEGPGPGPGRGGGMGNPDERFPPGGGNDPMGSVLPRLPTPNFTPLADGPVETMLAQADAYAAENPQNYRDIIDRYRQVMSKTRGTPLDRQVNDKLQRVVAAHQAASRQALQQYQQQTDAKLRAGDPQGAYDLWKTFPANLRNRETDQQIQQWVQQRMPQGFVPR
jgi:serine/threonine protein kinase